MADRLVDAGIRVESKRAGKMYSRFPRNAAMGVLLRSCYAHCLAASSFENEDDAVPLTTWSAG
jgi:hypothetical protein